MTKARQRLLLVLSVVVSLTIAAGLSLYALKDNISYFYPPSKIAEAPTGRDIRLGGMVKKGALEKRGDDLSIVFVITDYDADVIVEYTGILPDLFREGQGVVATGQMKGDVFIATEILAKHDENYMPPEVKKAMEGKAP
ncbi:MAG: cytochrome c maturation protein CcmE [Alphaproteobacteria bacterium]|nr:cytochrome c maturation protein CcmE [Alphaproteobacteria bacterium]